MIYLFSETNNILFLNWLGINNFDIGIKLPNWIRNYTPDFLWIFSLTSFIIIIWQSESKEQKLIFTLPLIIAFIFEFSQKYNLVSGTFDILDLFVYIVGFITSILLNIKFNKNFHFKDKLK